MERFNMDIESALKDNDIIKHNETNIKFHGIFLDLSKNERLFRYVKNLKMQLYDFPRRDYGEQWNTRNLQQHKEFIALVEAGKALEAADYMRDVHWNFELPDSFAIISDGK